MARDIEEFLRRAAERRQKQQGKQSAPQQKQRGVREIIEQRRVEIVEPEVVEVVPAKSIQRAPLNQRDAPRETLSEHVSSHIDSTDIAYHAEHLGDRIQNIDEKVAARIKRRFNHDVGQLDDKPTVQDDVVATVTKDEVSQVASDLMEMLRSPKSVRQAILVSEILKRPNFDD